MKKIVCMFIAIISVMALACFDDTNNNPTNNNPAQTKLAFTNSINSSGSISAINFANGAATWSGTYALGATTEAKVPTALSGSVSCHVDLGSGPVAATVVNESTNDSTFALESGAENVYTLKAVAK